MSNRVRVEQGVTSGIKRFRQMDQDSVGAERLLGNQLISVYPTLRCKPYDRTGAAAYSSISQGGGGTITLDEDKVDPCTGLPTAACFIPAGSTSYHTINYNDLTSWQMEANDSWFVTCYIPERLVTINVQLLVTDAASVTGSEYRVMTFSCSTSQVQKGWNVLQCLHVETRVDSATFGTVGTTMHGAWTNNSLQTDTTLSKSVAVRCKVASAEVADVTIHLGSVHTAPSGWAKAGIMWMFDDVPNSIYELAGPVIESYGWKYAVASCSGYAGDPTAGENVYMATKNLMTLLKKGHEVWNHTKTHENMDTATTQAKIRSINVSTAFWGGKGFSNATRFLAWPFGAYDDESITLIKDNGYLMARSIHGDGICPFSAGINPYYINAFAVENANPWRTDTMIEGSIRRGMGMITYAHDAVAGGQGVDSYPAGAKFYMDHFKRWCDRVAGHEANGNVVVTTPIDYYRLCGIDVFSHKFQE